MKYLDMLRKLSEKGVTKPTEPTKVTSVGFVPTLAREAGNLSDLDAALAELVRLHDEHVVRLNGRGIARVQLRDWRLALGLDEFEFWRVMRSLEESGQIIRECGLARPTRTTNKDSN